MRLAVPASPEFLRLARVTAMGLASRLQFTIDEPIYQYLMQHPDVAVSTWRVMGIS